MKFYKLFCLVGLAGVLIPAFVHAESVPAASAFQANSLKYIDCKSTSTDDSTKKRCFRDQLNQVDTLLNSEYNALRSQLKDNERNGLKISQLGWIKRRDRFCGLDRLSRNRDAWLDYIAESENRIRCVIDSTQEQIGRLQQLKHEVSAIYVLGEVEPPVEEPNYITEEVKPESEPRPEMKLRSSRSHRTGKYYFEIVLDDTLAGDNVTNVTSQVIVGTRSYSIGHEIKSRDLVLKLGDKDSVRIVGGSLGEDMRIPKVIIGWAIDLDAGRLYRHQDGIWLDDAPPGSGRGIVISLDSEVFTEIRATVPVATLIDKGILKPNFGEEAFSGYQPEGYRGFDWPDHLTKVLSDSKVPVTAPAKNFISRTSQEKWLQRYAEWVRSFPESESPSTDMTGERCGAGQSGEMWFLTGMRRPGKVQRECVVPEGKSILVPIANAIVQHPSDENPCDKIQVTLKKFMEGASDVRFSLDGKLWSESEIRQLGTNCFKLRNGATGQTTTSAVGGYWVFLPPLSKGRHVIEFGCRFKMIEFELDVTYIVHVR